MADLEFPWLEGPFNGSGIEEGDQSMPSRFNDGRIVDAVAADTANIVYSPVLGEGFSSGETHEIGVPILRVGVGRTIKALRRMGIVNGEIDEQTFKETLRTIGKEK